MNYIIKVLVIVISLSSVESVGASAKKVRKQSYVVKNYHKLPKKMPKLKLKQEKIVSAKKSNSSPVVQAPHAEANREIASESLSSISDPTAQVIQALVDE